MKLIDDAGKPTARYHSFLDDSEWNTVLADGIRDTFPDLFRVNKNTHTPSREQLTGKLKSLGEGKLSPAILSNTTKTFVELVKLADFSSAPSPTAPTTTVIDGEGARPGAVSETKLRPATPEGPVQPDAPARPTLVYRIEIVLPAVRDQAVYDAIFKSAREHLLR